MPDRARRLHTDWTLADRLAREAEGVVHDEWNGYFAGARQAPTQEALGHAAKLRQQATDKLNLLLAYLQQAAD